MQRIYYHLSHYISHHIAGRQLKEAMSLAELCLVERPEDADVIILHEEPPLLPPWIEKYGGKKKLIAYSVWETQTIPESWKTVLQGVDEIWTCSAFSARSFRKVFQHVKVVPHVVHWIEPTAAAVESLKRKIGFEEGAYAFYIITDSVNPRKDLKKVLEAFARTLRPYPQARLLVKQYRHAVDLSALPCVVSIDEALDEDEMAALHRVCDCYVSAHHCEAWGLSLSQAMAAGNLVIATGYSGNMEFMTEANSWPVRFALTPVSQEMCDAVPSFSPDMVWAEADLNHFVYLMGKAVRGKVPPELLERARLDLGQYSPARIGALIREALGASRV
jgi:glycosyltransferase involved in cell wall biosynthesis